MVKNLLKKFSNAVMLVALFGVMPAVAQEKLYIDGVPYTPGGEVDYFTIGLENGAHDDYTAFQFDLVLPAGLELAYADGEPEIYISEDDDVYTARRDDHAVTYQVHPDFVRVICYSPSNKVIASSGNLVDIYVTPSPYLKPGDIEIKLLNVKFGKVTEEYGFKADELILDGLTAEAACTLPVNVEKYGTVVFPFDVEEIPAGLEVYSCNSANGANLVLTKQSKAVAYTPYILYAENGFAGTLSGTVDAGKYSEVVTDGYLCGAIVAQEIGAGNGYYVMQDNGEGAAFYSVDASSTIVAGECWLALPAALQGSASFRLDGSTGIDEVKGESGEVKTVYDLQGRRVANPTKGIYIVGGKKVVVK